MFLRLITIAIVVTLVAQAGPAALACGEAAKCEGPASESGESHKLADDTEETATLRDAAVGPPSDDDDRDGEIARSSDPGFAAAIDRPPSR